MDEGARTRRVVLLVGTVVTVLTLLALIVPHALALRMPIAPTADPGAPCRGEEAPEVSEAPAPPPGCPAPEQLPAGSSLQVDWAPLLVASGRTYLATPTNGLTPAGEVVTVACDIQVISQGGRFLVPVPWPDGSSTVVRQGTVVHGILGLPTECYLMADDGYDTWLFEAIDAEGSPLTECQALPYPGR